MKATQGEYAETSYTQIPEQTVTEKLPELIRSVAQSIVDNYNGSLSSSRVENFVSWFLGFMLMLNGKHVRGFWDYKLKGRPLYNRYKVTIEKFSTEKFLRLQTCQYFEIILNSLYHWEEFRSFLDSDETLRGNSSLYYQVLINFSVRQKETHLNSR